MPAILAHQTFLRAYEDRQRDASLQGAIDECINRLMTNPRHPGLNTEQLFQAKEVPLYSARINDKYRIIFAWKPNDEIVLLNVDNHDEAYDWASAAKDRIERLVRHAGPWAPGPRPKSLPRLEEDEPLPIASIEALHRMLADGMERYLTYLDDFQRAYTDFDYTERRGLMFISGGAGTGKTAVAIRRAFTVWQKGELERRDVQYLCFNGVLAQTATEMFTALNGGRKPEGLFASTFHQWAGYYLNQRGRPLNMPKQHNWLANRVAHAIEEYDLAGAIAGLSVQRVVEEIGSLKRLGISGEEAYLELDRSGLGFSLRELQRRAIWQVFERVRFEQSGEGDWDDLIAIALEELSTDESFIGMKGVVVDEAQDCSPVMARLAREMVKGDDRRLMVLADPMQGIYRNGSRWARREFAPRGAQNVVLRRPYRSTKQVHALASSLYASVPEASTELQAMSECSREGPVPEIHITDSMREAEERLLDCLRLQLSGPAAVRRPQEIAILVSTRKVRDRVVQVLSAAEIIEREAAALSEPSVKVLTVPLGEGAGLPVRDRFLLRGLRGGNLARTAGSPLCRDDPVVLLPHIDQRQEHHADAVPRPRPGYVPAERHGARPAGAIAPSLGDTLAFVNNSRPVYSTESGRYTPPPPGGTNRKPQPPKNQPKSQPGLPDDGVVRIFREKGGRGGKTVTVVRGLPETGPQLEARVQELKRLCGAGGTLRDGAVEIQGDHRDRIAEKLQALGYKVKLAGG